MSKGTIEFTSNGASRMERFTSSVTDSSLLYGNTHILWLDQPQVLKNCRPGEFLMTYIGDGHDPLLGRALSIHRLREGINGPEFGLLFDVVGRGTHWLAQRNIGDQISFVGPLGHGFEVRPRVNQMLLVGGGIGCAPLIWLAEELIADDRNVTLVLGGRSKEQIFPSQLLPPEIEIVVTTEDGSLGEKGLVTGPFKRLLPWSDQVFACGPDPMFEALYQVTKQAGSGKSLQGLLEGRMACGFGICYSCAVFPKKGGVRLICTDGPQFDLKEIYS